MALSIYSITSVKNGETAPYCHVPELGGLLHTGCTQCTTCSQHVCRSHSVVISSSLPSLPDDEKVQTCDHFNTGVAQQTSPDIVLCMECFSTQYPSDCAMCASGVEQDIDDIDDSNSVCATNSILLNDHQHRARHKIKGCHQRCEDCGITLCLTHVVKLTACTEADIAEYYSNWCDDVTHDYVSSNHTLCDTCFEAHVFVGHLPFC